MVAEIGEADVEPVLDLPENAPRDADAARIGQGPQAVGDVDAGARNLVAVGQDFAEFDADADPRLAGIGG